MFKMSQNVMIAKGALDEANAEIARLQRELDGIKRMSTEAGPASELAAAHDTIYGLGLQVSDLQTENERLQEAMTELSLQKQDPSHGDSIKIQTLQEQLARLLSLRSQTEETLTTRLEHTMEDYKRAIERAEKAEDMLHRASMGQRGGLLAS